MSRDWRLLVDDVLRGCEKIRRYTTGMTETEFFDDDRTYDATLRNLEVIGEAAKRIPSEIRGQMQQIQWTKIAGMRDWLAHACFGLDPDILWDVIQNKLPELEQVVRAIKDTGFQESFDVPSDFAPGIGVKQVIVSQFPTARAA